MRALLVNERQRLLAVLDYKPYDHLPVVHFGFWRAVLQTWASQGHLSEHEATHWSDGNAVDASIGAKLGFDYNYYSCFHSNTGLYPGFEKKVVATFPDGTQHVQQPNGCIVLQRPDAIGIPAEVDHIFKGRKEWDELFRERLQFNMDRVNRGFVRANDKMVRFDQGGLDFLKKDDRTYPYGLHCGSLYGQIRGFMGLENACYLMFDDEPLMDEIINTVAELSYQSTKAVLASGAKFDFAHFWEDICFKNGPLISPAVFDAKVGPHYKRITSLVNSYGIKIVSLDCDGVIDSLAATWLNNGVNTMFPIEVGTWGGSIEPLRAKLGKELRGVGGMNKHVFGHDRAAVDAEIERLKPLVELGGFLPCPDHRIPPEAKWDNIRYYCDQMHKIFS